mmetsp:Transcript_10597/g.25965  ORF Transcript_10597/g.25965 Transcript_10597/m.25965 type:complete len:367 (+) Transcript_10597:169-1269(+)
MTTMMTAKVSCAAAPTSTTLRRSAAAPLRSASVAPLRRAASSSSLRCAAGGADGDKMVVAITGATGFVGKKLVETLMAEGHEVRILTRDSLAARLALPQATLGGAKFYTHDTLSGAIEWYTAVKGCTGVVNLAGAPISDPWNEDYKKTLVKSRLTTTNRLADAINAIPEDERPSLVSSSAVGYYGISTRDTFDEKSRAGKDFLANLCVQWEKAAMAAQTPATTIIRTGVVLEAGGGALGKILPIFQLFTGGPLGSGKQFVSWIHRDDLVALIIAALKRPYTYAGVVNGTAPVTTTMTGLCEAVAKSTNRPNWLPVPGFALKLILGEGATVVLDGQKVLPKRTESLGFQFQYPTVEEAVEAIVNGGS